MKWGNLFGSPAPSHVEAPAREEDAAMQRAKNDLESRIQLAVTDHNGKHLTERKWREYRDFYRSV